MENRKGRKLKKKCGKVLTTFFGECKVTTEFGSGSGTFLQRGSPPPPPWRLLPESLFFDKFKKP